MNPKNKSYNLLGITRSKAKMFEYNVPSQYHLTITKQPALLLSLTIGILGDYGKLDTTIESEDLINEYRKNLLFSAQFFDSFVESKLHSSFSNYYLLVGSAAYYLADLPGSASVLAKRIATYSINLDGDGLDDLLLVLLQSNTTNSINLEESLFSTYIANILSQLNLFYKEGSNEEQIFVELDSLCQFAYIAGTDRQLLFSDIIRSVVKKQINNSSWNSLKKHSTIDINQWKGTILKNTFIREFWPAQKVLGEKDIYKGKSAIIQMPTSAGKTKSLEIVIRSSFLSGRTNMAVIIAPFRALCSEIKDSLQNSFNGENISVDVPSDAIQEDFDLLEDFDFETSKLVLILTPEKFMYILRNAPEIVDNIGLLIYDEGHQFDNGIRGVTYELLLSSLKNKVSKNAQILLVSAVITNAETIGNWLISNEKEIISGINLLPTYRTIAFTNWKTQLGMLQFVKNDIPDEVEYYVPRVLEQLSLPLKGRERKDRLFPEKNDGKDIALYLTFKLIENGTVAIFCGSKITVKSIYEQVLELESRHYDVSNPLRFSDQNEVVKLVFLHSEHFGFDSTLTKSAKLGVFTHCANTPEGLRLAIEYSMQSEKIKLVICTSTLAQGVNLPIRYLMITSFYQAGQRIKIRDFHNLIGRAGRSGMHTEGSIIFTDTELFDKKNNRRENWKWAQAKKMLDPMNSEPCGSTLLSIFDPLLSDDKNYSVAVNPLEFVEAYIDSPETVSKLPSDFSDKHSDKKFSINGLTKQISFKIEIISSIESYLMAYGDVLEINANDDAIDNITKETLAYSISDDEQKQQLLELFRILAKNVNEKISSSDKKISYGRTLLGVEDILEIEAWTLSNLESLRESKSFEELLENIWPILYLKCSSNIKKLTPDDSSGKLSQMWIKGFTYVMILTSLQEIDTKIKAGSQIRNLNQEHIVDICQNSFSYSIALIIGAVSEIIKLLNDDINQELLDDLRVLQKMIKYGLPNSLAIAFYEIGFTDRVIAIDLSTIFDDFSYYKRNLIEDLKSNKETVIASLNRYPSYFGSVLKTIVEE